MIKQNSIEKKRKQKQKKLQESQIKCNLQNKEQFSINHIKLFCYQEIQHQDQIQPCKNQIIDYLQNQNIEYSYHNQTILINGIDSIRFQLTLNDCYSEEVLLLSKIKNLTMTELKLFNVNNTKDILVLQEINEIYIENLDLSNYVFNNNSILQIKQVKNLKINTFKNNRTMINEINCENFQIEDLNINLSKIRKLTVQNELLINNLQSIGSNSSILSDYIVINTFYQQQSDFFLHGKKNISIDVCMKCNLSQYNSQIIQINKLYFTNSVNLQGNSNSQSLIINNLIIHIENLDQFYFGQTQFMLNSFKKVEIDYLEINIDHLFFKFEDINTLELKNLNLNPVIKYNDMIDFNIDHCKWVKIESFQHINTPKRKVSYDFYITNTTQVIFRQVNIESAFFNQQFIIMDSIESVIIEDFIIKSIQIDSQSFILLDNCLNILFKRITIQIQNDTVDTQFINLTNEEIKNYQFDESNIRLSFIVVYQTEQYPSYFSQNITFYQINVDITGKNSRFLSVYNDQQQQSKIFINIINSNFSNMSGSFKGGCLNILYWNSKLNILSTKFYNCSSYFYGGAIFTNGLIFLDNVVFELCKSMFGGAIVIFQSNFLNQSKKNVKYINNQSKHYHDDIFIFWKFFVNEVIDISEKDQNGEILQKIQYDNFKLFPGITYILNITMKSEKYQQQNKEIEYIQNTLDEFIFQNLYSYIEEKTSYQSYLQEDVDQTICKSNAYLIFKINKPTYLNPENSIFRFKFKTQLDFDYKIINCKVGQQKILSELQQQIKSRKSFICEYCPLMFASYTEDSENCNPCSSLHFNYCYSNISCLNGGFYRDLLTLNVSQIYECKYNKQSCKGGIGVGNDLCAEGHIGNECKICDKYGEHWNQIYGSSRYYQCVKCSGLSNNMTYIIIFYFIFISMTLWIINNTSKNIQLQIQQDYISIMKKKKSGLSFKTFSLISVYAKVLTFNVSIIYNMQQQINIRFQKILLDFSIQFQNPLMQSIYSLDCALLQIFNIQNNYGFTKFLVIALFPLLSVIIIIIIQSILIFILKIKKRLFLKQILFSVLYLTFIVLYYEVLSAVLDYFFCITLTSGDQYSLLDLSVSCDKMQINKLVLYSVLVGYCFGIPLFVILILFKNRFKLQKINVMFKYGFLYKEYNQKLFYWEIIRFFIRVSQMIISKALFFNFVFMNFVSITIFLFYLILLLRLKPFKIAKINQLELISVFIIIINFFSLIIFQTQSKQSTSDSSKTAEEYLLLICLDISIIYIIGLLITIFCSFLQVVFNKVQRFQIFQNCYICRRRKIKTQKMMQNLKSFREAVSKVIYLNGIKNLELQNIDLLLEEYNQNQIQQQQYSEQLQQPEQNQTSIQSFEDQIILLQNQESINKKLKQVNNYDQNENQTESIEKCEQNNIQNNDNNQQISNIQN